MSDYFNYYYKYKKEIVNEPDVIFIGLAQSIAEVGTIDDLKALCKAYKEDKKATAPTVTKKNFDTL